MLTLALFAYVGVVFVVHIDWAAVGLHLIVPKIAWTSDYLTPLVAILGTTISPYLFFWQAEEEIEEVKERDGAKPLSRAPRQAKAEFGRIRVDTYIGMALSNVVALFIIITTAVTLNAHGVTNIQTSSQAAEALKPIAGAGTLLFSRLALWGLDCWPCLSWLARPPTQPEKPSAGTSGLPEDSAARRLSTRPSSSPR